MINLTEGPANLNIKSYRALQFTDGATPTNLLRDARGPLISGEMPCCGHRYAWYSVDEIPTEDTPCPCEREGFWLVKYE